MTNENVWSEWLDFNEENIQGLPSSPGVFMMHASMKILYIDSSEDIRTGIVQCKLDPCIREATRFRFLITDSLDRIKAELIRDYQERHNGSLPKCMQL